MPTSQTPAADEPSFEEILSRLSEVVEHLEGGELTLSRSLEIFEEGVGLSRLGARRLDDAEARVEQLLSNDEGLETRPLPTRNPDE
ncbi:MAG: exodeoxyribonuclease VII small subunit [Deltaproteobacteria bacterium]|nr:MAG: exodeoxyribonuclease VII small subunit [Deltaproteobacteria bacterium]